MDARQLKNSFALSAGHGPRLPFHVFLLQNTLRQDAHQQGEKLGHHPKTKDNKPKSSVWWHPSFWLKLIAPYGEQAIGADRKAIGSD
jgi:hypothetical protein